MEKQLATRVAEGIYLIPVPFFEEGYYTNAVLVKDTENILIDSGDAPETVHTCIIPAMESAGVKPEELGYVLCTHYHGDHVHGHAELEKLGAKVLLTPTQEECDHRGRIHHTGLLGESIGRLKVIATPGHSRDSVSYLDERTGTLITGDSFQATGTFGVGLALIELIDTYLGSVEKARALDPERIVAGHAFCPYPALIEGKAQINAFFDCCISTVANYRRFVREHKDLDLESLTLAMVDAFGRKCERYIVRGDSIVEIFLKEALENK